MPAAGAIRSHPLERAWWRRGPLARALLPAAWLFGLLSSLRRALYRHGWLHCEPLPVPVVVVGNLIAGGAGKTPTVMAVVELLRARGWSPGVISRGYGRAQDGVVDVNPQTDVRIAGDEPLLLRIRLGRPVVVGRDRVAAARSLLQAHPEVDIIVSDDGLQHLRLPRAAQVLVFDERGAGNGWLLPAGPLREEVPARVAPRSVVLYNAARPSTALPGHLARRSLGAPVILHGWWSGMRGSDDPPPGVGAQGVFAAAGMAHPARFFGMLEAAGHAFTALPLPDHFDFSVLPWPAYAADVFITEKDAVKLRPERVGATRVWVVPLDFHPGADFERALLALLPPLPTRTPHGHPIA
jgi:tetraacyldisaccharide 4'-kinase